MPAATPLHILRARLLEEQAAVAVAQQALAAATARVITPRAPPPALRARLEEIEAQIAAVKKQQAEDVKGAAEARARAERCRERREQIAVLLTDFDPTPQERSAGGPSTE